MVYTWLKDENEEMGERKCFDSIEECIKDARANCGDLKKFYIIENEEVPIEGIQLKDVLNAVEICMREKCGEMANDWDISSVTGKYSYRQAIYDKYNKKLEKLTMEYLRELSATTILYEATGYIKVEL